MTSSLSDFGDRDKKVTRRVPDAAEIRRAARPAILGGEPVFSRPLPILRPALPPADELLSDFRGVLDSGMVTNGRWVRRFEAQVAHMLGVRNCVAVSSCTTGLMLLVKALGLEGEVIVPSFTFCATAHAVAWNGLRPVFADCRSDTYNIDPQAVAAQVTSRTSAVLAVHVFGNPAAAEALADLCTRHGLALLFDAAHAFGAQRHGRMVGGFGDAEVFSLTPTKVLTACEGGLVATNDDGLAERLRVGRNYGNPGDYDCTFVGLSARMPELNAVVGVHNLSAWEQGIARRAVIARRYGEGLARLPGLGFQMIEDGVQSTWKDFTLTVDEGRFGISRDRLCEALAAENVDVRKYFSPPVHRMRAYRDIADGSDLPVTDGVSAKVVSLPIYPRLDDKEVDAVVAAFRRLHEYRLEIMS